MPPTEMPLQALTVVAGAAITARRFVAYDDQQAGVAGEKVMGVAQRNAEVGDAVAVTRMGTAIVETGGAFSRGDAIMTDASGRAVEHAGDTEYFAGDALGDSGGAGEFVEIALR